MTSPVAARPPASSAGRLFRRVLTAVIVFGAACVIVWGFLAGRGERAKEAARERPIVAPLRVSEVNGQPAVKLDPQARKSSGIEVAALVPAPFQPQLQGYGTVLDLTQLTTLDNSYASARAQLQVAQAKLAASKAASDRASALYKHQQNVSLAQVQAAEATLQSDEAALAVAKSQVRTAAAMTMQAFGRVVGKAIEDGAPFVTRLIEQQDVLVQVSLPPGAAMASPPQTATMLASNGSPTSISFVSPAPRTDPRIQGLSFLYLAPADSGALPGMNVSVSLPFGPSRAGVTIPPAAIVWWEDRAWIYRQTVEGTFVRNQIATDLPAPGGGYVVASLPADTEIVTRGAQALLSEEFRAQLHVNAD